MNKYISFFKEREGCDVVETDHGFAAYFFTPQKQLFCHQFFVHRDYRKSGEGRKLLKEVEEKAQVNGMTSVVVTVQSNHDLKHETLMAVISCGFIFKGLNTIQNLLFEKAVQ